MTGTPGTAATRDGEAPERSPPCGPSHDLTGKVMLLGDSGVGKTCFLIRFRDGAFLSGTFIATVGIDFRVRWLQAPPPSGEPGVTASGTGGCPLLRPALTPHIYSGSP
ncbi:TPA: RAB37, member RAS oncogene family-like [Bos taurus]|nr:TPA: RAB37, member RAS oncogene family-like [Bos taurus]